MSIDDKIEALTSERGGVYGPPSANHGATGALFFEWLERRYNGHVLKIDALDVCTMNICQKLSRLAESPEHQDSWADIAGYAQNALTIISE